MHVRTSLTPASTADRLPVVASHIIIDGELFDITASTSPSASHPNPVHKPLNLKRSCISACLSNIATVESHPVVAKCVLFPGRQAMKTLPEP